MYECRICLEEDEIENLISPCLCRGTSKYIHETCLNEWRTLSENRDNERICPQCKFEYKLQEQNLNPGGLKCFNLFVNLCAKNIVSLIIFNFLIFVITYYLLYWLNNSNFYIHGSNEDEIYDALEFKTFNVFQLSSILITTFYILIIIVDFILTINKKLLYSYYKRKLLIPQIFLYIFGLLFTFFHPVFGLLLNTLLINSIMKCYIDYHKEINSIAKRKVLSISDQELIELNI
jgi:hypothetical protein